MKGQLATPERRAALEARIGELSNAIRDEVVRRYYPRIWPSACNAPLRRKAPAVWQSNFRGGGANEAGRRFAPRGSFTPGPAGRFEPRGGRGQGAPPARPSTAPLSAASAQLATSPIMRGQRSALSRREALILQSLINHPGSCTIHLEQVAALELAHRRPTSCAPALSQPSPATITIPGGPRSRPRKCGPISKQRISQILQRVTGAITTSRFGACNWGRTGRCSFHLQQLVALHQKPTLT